MVKSLINTTIRVHNKNSGWLYSAQIYHLVMPMVLLLPLVTGQFISFLKPSQLSWEYTDCDAKYEAHLAINQSQKQYLPLKIQTHLHLGDEKQL